MQADIKVQDLPVVDLEGPSRLGFATTCFVHAVIDLPELKAWAESIVLEQEHPETILFDILDFKDSKPQFYRLLRERLARGPFFALEDDQADALSGIRYTRDPETRQDYPGQKDRQLAALERHPEVMAAFRSEFPFVSFD